MGEDYRVKVSVVVPVHNREDLIEKCIKSVLNQNYKDFELIVVNDGSTDDTDKTISEFDDSRLKHIELNDNIGQSAARNVGVRNSSGNYIKHLDSDDELLESHLSTVINKLESQSNRCAGVFTGHYTRKKGWGDKRQNVKSGVLKMGDLLVDRDDIPGLSCLTIRREVLNKIGLHDESIIKATDLDYYLEILKEYYLYGMDKPLYIRNHNDSMESRKVDNRIVGERRMISKWGHLLDDSHIAKRRFKVGDSLLEKRKHSEAGEEFDKCLGQNMNKMDRALYCNKIGRSYSNYCLYDEGSRYLINAYKNKPVNIRYLVEYGICKMTPQLWEPYMNYICGGYYSYYKSKLMHKYEESDIHLTKPLNNVKNLFK